MDKQRDESNAKRSERDSNENLGSTNTECTVSSDGSSKDRFEFAIQILTYETPWWKRWYCLWNFLQLNTLRSKLRVTIVATRTNETMRQRKAIRRWMLRFSHILSNELCQQILFFKTWDWDSFEFSLFSSECVIPEYHTGFPATK